MVEQSYTVTGMTCASCAAHAQKAAAKLPGVEHCEVNLATERMTVRYDEEEVTFELLRGAVEDAGYGLEKQEQVRQVELGIEGMTCAACQAAVERATRKLPGVRGASVNLTTNRGVFVYEPAQVKLSEIMAAIEDAGYTPRELEGEHERDLEQERRAKALLRERVKLIVAAVFAAPVLYIAMGHMFP